jgi:hypothetical protein
MADQSNNVPSSRPRLGARPFAGRPGERPTPAPAGGDQTLSRPFAAPVARPARNSFATTEPIAEVWTTASNPDRFGAAADPLGASAALDPRDVPAAVIAAEKVDGLAVSLDEELRHFKLQSSEIPPVPTPFPELDAAPNELHPAIAFRVERGNEGRAALEEPAVAFRDPMDREFLAPDSRGATENDLALTEALDDAKQLSFRVDAATALDTVAQRVRSGEIVLAPASGTGSRTDAALLVAVLAALLGESA